MHHSELCKTFVLGRDSTSFWPWPLTYHSISVRLCVQPIRTGKEFSHQCVTEERMPWSSESIGLEFCPAHQADLECNCRRCTRLARLNGNVAKAGVSPEPETLRMTLTD